MTSYSVVENSHVKTPIPWLNAFKDHFWSLDSIFRSHPSYFMLPPWTVHGRQVIQKACNLQEFRSSEQTFWTQSKSDRLEDRLMPSHSLRSDPIGSNLYTGWIIYLEVSQQQTQNIFSSTAIFLQFIKFKMCQINSSWSWIQDINMFCVANTSHSMESNSAILDPQFSLTIGLSEELQFHIGTPIYIGANSFWN